MNSWIVFASLIYLVKSECTEDYYAQFARNARDTEIEDFDPLVNVRSENEANVTYFLPFFVKPNCTFQVTSENGGLVPEDSYQLISNKNRNDYFTFNREGNFKDCGIFKSGCSKLFRI